MTLVNLWFKFEGSSIKVYSPIFAYAESFFGKIRKVFLVENHFYSSFLGFDLGGCNPDSIQNVASNRKVNTYEIFTVCARRRHRSIAYFLLFGTALRDFFVAPTLDQANVKFFLTSNSVNNVNVGYFHIKYST